RDGRTMVCESTQPSKIDEYLASFEISLPGFMQVLIPNPTTRWDVIDVSSSKTIVSLPRQQEVPWLSADQKTLVTESLDSPRTINVWDFPPHRPLWNPIRNALVVPAILLSIVFGVRGRFRRNLPQIPRGS